MGAPRFNAPSLGHKEDFSLLPEEIIIDETLNGRFEPHTQDKVIQRAYSLIVNGQIEPVGIRRAHDEDKRPKLVFGYLRTLAAKYINEELLPKGGVEIDGTYYKIEKPFRLWASQVEGDDKSSLIKNIIENFDREGTTIMDLVKNQNNLAKFGATDEEIANIYRTPVANIRRNRDLLSLPRNVQSMIHRGILSAEAGFYLLTVDEATQNEIIADAQKEAEESGLILEHSEQEFRNHIPTAGNHPKIKLPGTTQVSVEVTEKIENAIGEESSKIPTRAIASRVRAAKQKMGKKGPALSFSEFKTILKDLDIWKEDAIVREFACKTLALVRGDITTKQWHNVLYKIRDEQSARTPSGTKPEETDEKSKPKKHKAKTSVTESVETLVTETVGTPDPEPVRNPTCNDVEIIVPDVQIES